MIIRDKQELKRAVKQAVRRAQIVETDFAFDVHSGSMGVSELLQTWAAPSGAPNDALRRACAQGTPFDPDAAAMFAALSALELPAHNLNNAQTIQESYDRNAYLREVLDAMHARRVLVRVPADHAHEAIFDDDRFSAMLHIDCFAFFKAGRYGIDYADKASEIIRLLESCAAKDLLAEYADGAALRYALIPVSEDTGCVLHLYAANEEQVCELDVLFEEHPSAKAAVFCDPGVERYLIDSAQFRVNILPRISDPDNMRYALSKLNTRFIPFASGAALPEQMLGRWELARETIWQTLLDAYLPLARSGYELTSEAIARDVAQLLGGNLDSLYSDMT